MATILGLLLVVTFVGNYISTTLPVQMAANDTQHTMVIENELGRLSALAQATSEHGAPGAQVSQPIILGSEGVPPFAVPDPSRIVPSISEAGATMNFSLTGADNPPTGGIPNTGVYSGGCSNSSSGGKVIGINCNGGGTVFWNFSAGDGVVYQVGGVGGLSDTVNFTTSNSTIAVTSTGGQTTGILVIGSNDTVYLNATGGASTSNVSALIFGDHDTFIVSAKGGANVVIVIVGMHDATSVSLKGGSTVRVVGYGSYLSYTGSLGSGGSTNIYWNGFDSHNPLSSVCPYGNLANTDNVSGTAGTVTYNNTNYSHSGSSGNASGWTYVYNNPPTSTTTCPFFPVNTVAQSLAGGSFAVDVFNSYIPSSVVGFDQGGVVFAQPGGTPIFIEKPAVDVNGTAATIWLPYFTTTSIPSAGGTGVVNVVLRLVSTLNQSWPAGGFNFSSNTSTILTIITPFGPAWVSYLKALPATTPLSVTCTLLGSPLTTCPSTFQNSATAEKVVATLHVATITVQYALFQLSIS